MVMKQRQTSKVFTSSRSEIRQTLLIKLPVVPPQISPRLPAAEYAIMIYAIFDDKQSGSFIICPLFDRR